jgi:MFS family permease
MSDQNKRTLIGLFAATLFVFASFTSFFPVLPLYLKSMGSSNLQVGAVMSSFPIGVLAFRPLVSWMLNRKGRKWTLMFGTLTLACTTGCYLLAQDIPQLMIVRFFHGTGIAAFTTASIVLISDVTTYTNRGHVMGVVGVANYVGFGIGPYAASKLYHAFSIDMVFLYALILAILAIAMVLIIQKQNEPHFSASKGSWKQALKKRYILVPCLFVFIVALIQGGIVNFLPVFLQVKASQVDAGLFFLVFSFSVLLIRILAGKAADRYGRGIVIFSATSLLSLSIAVLSMTTSLWFLVLASLLYGLGYGSQQPTLTAFVADNTTFANRGAVFSVYYSIFDLGMLSSGYFFGGIADTFGVQMIYPVAAGLYVLGVLFFITMIQDSVKRSLKWVISLRSPGKLCKICYQPMGTDPCHICGHRGGFVKSK